MGGYGWICEDIGGCGRIWGYARISVVVGMDGGGLEPGRDTTTHEIKGS